MSIRVKICGIRTAADVRILNELRPDYAGFVFAESSRRIDFETAKAVRLALQPEIAAVGVFAGNEIDTVLRLCKEGVIQLIQLHGEESEEFIYRLKTLTDIPIIKAVRVKEQADGQSLSRVETAADYVLFDSYSRAALGGTGKRIKGRLPLTDKPFFIAGGINPDNVKEVLGSRPFGVDCSSGVETDGKKDRDKIARLLAAVKEFEKRL